MLLPPHPGPTCHTTYQTTSPALLCPQSQSLGRAGMELCWKQPFQGHPQCSPQPPGPADTPLPAKPPYPEGAQESRARRRVKHLCITQGSFLARDVRTDMGLRLLHCRAATSISLQAVGGLGRIPVLWQLSGLSPRAGVAGKKQPRYPKAQVPTRPPSL